MTTHSGSRAMAAPPARHRGRTVRDTPVGGVLAAVGLLVVAAFVVLRLGDARAVEAALSVPLLRAFAVPGAGSAADALFFSDGSGTVHILLISSLCSATVVVVPMLVAGGIIVLLPRFSPGRVLTGTFIGVLIAVVGNVLRIDMIGFAWWRWGMSGFEAAHTGYGSIFALVCYAAGMISMVAVAVRRGRD